MRKLILMLLVLLTACSSTTTTTTQVTKEDALKNVQKYYEGMESFESLDDVIGYEASGLESDELELSRDLINESTSASLSKSIIALALHGEDVSEYVDALNTAIHDNGAISFTSDQAYANEQAYGVFALYVISSDKLTLAADYLASTIQENGSFKASYGEDLDVTCWAITALALVDINKYQDTINKAIDYVNNTYNDGYYEGGYGSNPDTQANVLTALYLTDHEILEEAINTLISFQNKDGSFYHPSTGEGEINSYATDEASEALATLVSENIYIKAKEDYEKVN